MKYYFSLFAWKVRIPKPIVLNQSLSIKLQNAHKILFFGFFFLIFKFFSYLKFFRLLNLLYFFTTIFQNVHASFLVCIIFHHTTLPHRLCIFKLAENFQKMFSVIFLDILTKVSGSKKLINDFQNFRMHFW